MTIEKEETVTEAYRRVMQEAALNELFGFFQNKAKRFSNQAQNVAYHAEPARNDASIKVYRNPKLFPGEVYLDHTHLPKQKWSLFRGKSTVPVRGNLITRAFNLIFILGYELDVTANVFYEIWFDSYSSTYVILDKYAIPVSSQFPNLDATVADFIDVISEENPHVPKGDLSFNEKELLKRLARRGSLSPSITHEAEQAEEKKIVEQLLEATGITRQILTQMVNDKVTEYHTTKMNTVAVKKFWNFWGKFIQVPQKYISHGFIGALQKIVGRAKTATFIVGFSLKNLIFIEIWYVRDNSTHTGSYFVFDLTSGEIVAQNIKTIRQAYTEAGKKILVPTQFLGKIE